VLTQGRIVPEHALLWHAEDTTPYECDGLTAYRQRPLVVCLPETDEDVPTVLHVCHQLQVPGVARGADTGLFDTEAASPHAHYLCWSTGTIDCWECAAFADWLRKTMA
jgi:glycolate oxidase